MVEIMAKFKQIEETDFNFSKRPVQTPTYFLEKFVTLAFITVFTTLIFFGPTVKPPPLKFNDEPAYNTQEASPTYPDYIVTGSDKMMLESIFNYDKSSTLLKDKDVKNLQDNLKQIDLLNGNFDNNKKFTVSSSILAIEPSDKNVLVQETGDPDLDYVDVIVQKTYTQDKESYFEQQMVSLALDNHQIVSMKTNRIID